MHKVARAASTSALAATKSVRLVSELNAIINAAPVAEPAQLQNEGRLNGLSVAVKDNICTGDGLPTTCGSEALETFVSPSDATCVRLLRNAGARITAKTNLDEFGMGSHSQTSAFGRVLGHGKVYSPGGSSGGSAAAIHEGLCDVALGTDTGGSVRLPAAYFGLVGFKPSYGRISRHGVVAYANSLDTVGILGKSIGNVSEVFHVLDKYDSQDPTSMTISTREKSTHRPERDYTRKGYRIGVPQEYRTAEMVPAVRAAWLQALKHLKDQGHLLASVSLPHTREALAAYYILAPSEASSNLAKFDGVRYGASIDKPARGPLFAASRVSLLGSEVRRRILLGSYTLSASAFDNYFRHAQVVRRLVRTDFDRVFALDNILAADRPPKDAQTIDAIICPTSVGLPPRIEQLDKQSLLETYAGDVLTIPASLAGLPTVTVPIKLQAKDFPEAYGGVSSVGLQVMAQYGDDRNALAIAGLLEQLAQENSRVYH